MSRPLKKYEAPIIEAKERFIEIAQQDDVVSFEKESMFALQALQKNDFLLKTAENNQPSLFNAIINVASVGISLNPALAHAYLVPRDGSVVLDISYRGMIQIATDTGSILWCRADVVYETDNFEYNGKFEKPIHKKDPFKKDPGEVVGVYCVAKTLEGDYLVDTMTVEEINEIRDKTEAYKSYVKRGMKGFKPPWVTYYNEMAKKTIIKRAQKTWPKTDKTDRISKAVDVLNQHEGIDFGSANILGMNLDELVDMEKVDKKRVENLIIEAREVIDDDDMDEDEARDRLLDIDSQLLNGEERTVFDKMMSARKHGAKTQRTIYYEMIAPLEAS